MTFDVNSNGGIATFTGLNGTLSTGTSIGPITTNVVDGNTFGGQWSDNLSWTWTCPSCGTLVHPGLTHSCPTGLTGWTCASCGVFVVGGTWHVCGQFNQQPLTQTKPHCCPVCGGRGRVLFDPEAPYAQHSAVQDWPCKPCNATGIVWGF